MVVITIPYISCAKFCLQHEVKHFTKTNVMVFDVVSKTVIAISGRFQFIPRIPYFKESSCSNCENITICINTYIYMYHVFLFLDHQGMNQYYVDVDF